MPQKDRSLEELIHHQTILIEDLNAKFDTVTEGLGQRIDSLRNEFNERFKEQDQRFDGIESILKVHSRMLEKNEERWQQNEERWQRTDQRLDRMEGRLDRIEGKLDHVIEKVEHHAKDIRLLKKATGTRQQPAGSP